MICVLFLDFFGVGTSDAPAAVKSTEVSSQKSTRSVPKAPAHNSSTVGSNTVAPSTPAKGLHLFVFVIYL